MGRTLVLVLLLAASPAVAADKVLILSDQEQAALQKIFDAAVRHSGMELAPAAVFLQNKLNAAGTVVDKPKDVTPTDGSDDHAK